MSDSSKPGRQWIVDLVRDQFDPAPAHYRFGEAWDDGAEASADAILAQLPLLVAENAPEPATTPAAAVLARACDPGADSGHAGECYHCGAILGQVCRDPRKNPRTELDGPTNFLKIHGLPPHD
jgi:hypothetical protein